MGEPDYDAMEQHEMMNDEIADLRRQLEEAKGELAAGNRLHAQICDKYTDLQREVEQLQGYKIGKCEKCLHVYVGHGLGAGCSHCEVERLREAANLFVEASENHRLQLIVEDYVTEETKAAYRVARENLGKATGGME